MRTERWTVWLGLVVLAGTLRAQGLPVGQPGPEGLSEQRLERLTRGLEQAVQEGHLPGAVVLLCRHGKTVYQRTAGFQDRQADVPMRADALFRIASMSKPITTVAAMMLYEEGRFLLSDPVSKYLPRFASPQVVTRDPNTGEVIRVPARREIAVRHLMNHTSGITYGEGLHRPLYHEAGMTVGLGPTEGTLAQMMERLAPLPLISHPGEEFHYGLSVDVLGYLVEVLSGQSLEQFMQERIFQPLGMVDTGFIVLPEKLSRLAKTYRWADDHWVESDVDLSYLTRQTYFSGGAGLVSTAADYARFAQMILNGGQLGGVRLLSPKTIDLMTTNSIGDLYIPFRIIGDKFGYGFGLRTERGQYDELESLGIFGWDGAFYTRCWMDPKEGLIGIVMSQVENHWADPTMSRLRVLTYQALVR